jgi:hypothetical protein
MPLLSSSFKSSGGIFCAPAVSAGIALVLMTALGGCSGMSKALGGGKRPPDEFTVVGRAPLVVPPDYNLMPPRDAKPDEVRKTDVDPRKMAIQALFPAGRTDLPGSMPAVPSGAISGSPLPPDGGEAATPPAGQAPQ